MKKILTITLLLVFLFNVGGYYIVFWALRIQADKDIISQIENNCYNNEQTILLKVPFSLPYPVSDDYQFVKGKFEHQGEYYKLIKQKLENDTLYIICVKDNKTKQIQNKMIEYGSLSNDLPAQSKQSFRLLGKLLKEYTPFNTIEIVKQDGWVSKTIFNNSSFHTIEIVKLIQSPPPKSIF